MSMQLPASVSSKQLPPDPEGTATYMSRIGYSLEEALADIIDNSIDARSSRVLVRFVRGHDRITQIVIADDGDGMSPGDLHAAMQYGVRHARSAGALGKYGIGLKAAAFSQGKSLCVMSRKGGEISGRRWTVESIKDDWRLELLDGSQVAKIFELDWDPISRGELATVVVLDRLDSLSSTVSDFTRNLDKTIVGLSVDLGLRFHRFLESGSLSIVLDTVSDLDRGPETQFTVEPLDPFAYPTTGRKGYPATFEFSVGGRSVRAVAHIWPPKSGDSNYKLGKGKVAARQGFYFYRNNRLIKAGGWHQLQGDGEPHLSLARVLVEMPPDLDSKFRLSVQKNDFNVPPEFIDAVKDAKAGNTSFTDYLKAAQETYRDAPEPTGNVFYPKKGLPAALSRELRALIRAGSKGTMVPVRFVWAKLSDEEFFAFDSESREIVLNRTYRSQITGDKNSGADAPAFKVALFFAIEEILTAGRLRTRLRERIALLNAALVQAARHQ